MAIVPLTSPATAGGPQPAELIAALQPAVVNLGIVTRETAGAIADNIAGQPTRSERSEQGAGFFISSNGIIVTNRHTIAGATEIFVTLHDATKLKACVVAAASQSDIALLKVNLGRPVPTAKFGDSGALRPGDPVFVIGNPLGHGNTVTAGIVSALERTSAESLFSSFLQIDASLNHGNSGGPVFNSSGEVIGVATALFAPPGETGSVGLGLAIPSRDAEFIIERLLEYGQVQLGWIGVHIQPVTADVAAALAIPTVAGSIITAVDDDSPAARAGLRIGDVISRFGDDDETGPHDLNRKIAGSRIGSVAKVTIWQGGDWKTVPVVIGRSPSEKDTKDGQTSAPCDVGQVDRPDLGLILGPVTADLRAKLGLPAHDTGVAVIDVVPNSVASDHGLSAGSVIVSVFRQPVGSPAEMLSAIDTVRAEHRKLVLILARDVQGLRWVALPLQ